MLNNCCKFSEFVGAYLQSSYSTLFNASLLCISLSLSNFFLFKILVLDPENFILSCSMPAKLLKNYFKIRFLSVCLGAILSIFKLILLIIRHNIAVCNGWLGTILLIGEFIGYNWLKFWILHYCRLAMLSVSKTSLF